MTKLDKTLIGFVIALVIINFLGSVHPIMTASIPVFVLAYCWIISLIRYKEKEEGELERQYYAYAILAMIGLITSFISAYTLSLTFFNMTLGIFVILGVSFVTSQAIKKRLDKDIKEEDIEE